MVYLTLKDYNKNPISRIINSTIKRTNEVMKNHNTKRQKINNNNNNSDLLPLSYNSVNDNNVNLLPLLNIPENFVSMIDGDEEWNPIILDSDSDLDSDLN